MSSGYAAGRDSDGRSRLRERPQRRRHRLPDGVPFTLWQNASVCLAFICNCSKETAMNWDQVKGNWKQMKGRVRQKWGELTDDDLDKIEGRREELVGRLQERYGYERDRAEREIEQFCANC
jgi:uncharacterized protein YjbJ (UPF0337 family)